MTDNLQGLLGTSGRGVLATIRRNGRPQLSNVDFCYDAEASLIRVRVDRFYGFAHST